MSPAAARSSGRPFSCSAKSVVGPAPDEVREAASRVRDVCARIGVSSIRISTGARGCRRSGSRSIRRAPARWVSPAGYRPDAADAGGRGDGDDAEGRREPGRRRRPRDGGRARRARPGRGSDGRLTRRRGCAGRAGRARHPHDGGADHLAHGSGSGGDRGGGCRRRRPAARRLPVVVGDARADPRSAAAGNAHRNGRGDRGIRRRATVRSSSCSRSWSSPC